MKERDEELVDRGIERSGIFFIWSGRPRMMNSVLEGLSRGALATSIYRLGSSY